jgi:mannan endo-1,4-beta-mannosidase
MEGLFRQTGKYCAILGSDLEDLSTQNQSGAHAILKSFWDQKGLVTLSWHAANPWTGGDSWDRSRVTLWDLSDSSSRVYTRWVAQVDSVAAALKDLSASGVVVLFRPFHEMNGDWFWWGASSQSNDPAAFVALWQWLYRYLTEQHQLTNLIWVYSPNAVTHSSYVKPVGWAYPGADRVDLVALDIYTDYLVIRDYADLVALQKPLGISEFGPGDGRSGNYDNTETIRAIREHYPQIVFWAQYCDWQNRNGFWVYKSLLRNPNAAALLNDSWVLTRDELNWLD